MPDSVLIDIGGISEIYYPKEACGLLIGGRGKDKVYVNEFREAINIFDSSRSFKISPRLVFSVLNELEEKEELVGFFHSHPNMSPYVSSRDRKFMKLWKDKIWIIEGTDSEGKIEAIRGYRKTDNEMKEMEIKLD